MVMPVINKHHYSTSFLKLIFNKIDWLIDKMTFFIIVTRLLLVNVNYCIFIIGERWLAVS